MLEKKSHKFGINLETKQSRVQGRLGPNGLIAMRICRCFVYLAFKTRKTLMIVKNSQPE